jgi:tetratricopeptide (TPR) repeat protein
MFVFLALAFGLGFVLFGVGSGSSGISQAMQSLFSQSSGGGSSLSSLQKKATDHPKDATAWRNLATKLEQDKQTDLALTSLEHYVSLKPKDQNALDELASLYLRRAQDYNNAWSAALTQLQITAPDGIFQPKSTSPLGKAYANQDPITALVVKQLNASASAASQQLGLLTSKAESAYQRLVKLAPANATYQFQYAAIAQSLGQKPIAIKAYKAFLKLAPNDALAPRATQQLKLLSPPAAKK